MHVFTLNQTVISLCGTLSQDNHFHRLSKVSGTQAQMGVVKARHT